MALSWGLFTLYCVYISRYKLVQKNERLSIYHLCLLTLNLLGH